MSFKTPQDHAVVILSVSEESVTVAGWALARSMLGSVIRCPACLESRFFTSFRMTTVFVGQVSTPTHPSLITLHASSAGTAFINASELTVSLRKSSKLHSREMRSS